MYSFDIECGVTKFFEHLEQNGYVGFDLKPVSRDVKKGLFKTGIDITHIDSSLDVTLRVKDSSLFIIVTVADKLNLKGSQCVKHLSELVDRINLYWLENIVDGGVVGGFVIAENNSKLLLIRKYD